MHPGVYVDHTGPPTWDQRAWAAVLFFWPAALCRESVVHPGRLPIHVMVAAHRARVRLPGVVVHRSRGLDTQVRWNTGPPRQRLEHAVIDLAAAATDRWGGLAVLAEAVRERRTTVGRLREALAGRARVRHRVWLLQVLDDRLTIRLGWGQVVGRPCVTAARLELLLQRRGWTGQAHPCGPRCTLRVG